MSAVHLSRAPAVFRSKAACARDAYPFGNVCLAQTQLKGNVTLLNFLHRVFSYSFFLSFIGGLCAIFDCTPLHSCCPILAASGTAGMILSQEAAAASSLVDIGRATAFEANAPMPSNTTPSNSMPDYALDAMCLRMVLHPRGKAMRCCRLVSLPN
eukprot:IDg3473t1